MTLKIGRRALLAALPGLALPPVVLAGEAFAQAAQAKPTPADAPNGPVPGLEWVMDASLDAYGRTLATGMVNGQGPFRFMLDTGATTSALSLALAKRLGLTYEGEAVIHGTTGQATMPVARVERFEVGSVSKQDLRIVVLTDPFGARADGIIGADIFAGRRVVFDIENQTVRIGGPRGRAQVKIDGTFRLRTDSLAEVRGRVGRVRCKMILDTGAVCSLLNLALREELREVHPNMQTLPRVGVSGLTGQVLVGEGVYLPDVTMRGIEVTRAVGVAVDAPVFHVWDLMNEPAMIVGADILSRMPRFAIDYGSGTFEIGPNAILRKHGDGWA